MISRSYLSIAAFFSEMWQTDAIIALKTRHGHCYSHRIRSRSQGFAMEPKQILISSTLFSLVITSIDGARGEVRQRQLRDRRLGKGVRKIADRRFARSGQRQAPG